MHRAVTCR